VSEEVKIFCDQTHDQLIMRPHSFVVFLVQFKYFYINVIAIIIIISDYT
jgi:hypothetical protein